MYEIKDVPLATIGQNLTVIALSFQVLPEVNRGNVFSNKSKTRGVTISKESIIIVRTSLQLKHQEGWNTLILQYSYIDKREMTCFYLFNEDRGTFTQKLSNNFITILQLVETKINTLMFWWETLVYLRRAYASADENSYLLPDEILDLIKKYTIKRLVH